MTAKEAIDEIKVAQALIEWDYPISYAIAFDEAIRRIEIFEKLKEEIVSMKQDLKRNLKQSLEHDSRLANGSYLSGYMNALSDMEKRIKNLESV